MGKLIPQVHCIVTLVPIAVTVASHHFLHVRKNAFHFKWTLFSPTSGLLMLLVTVDVRSWAKTIHVTDDDCLAPFCYPRLP